jgi:hypothetical protein
MDISKKRRKPPGSGRKRGVLNKCNAELRMLAQEYTEQAIETLCTLMTKSTNESVRLHAASALLDRGHGRPPREQPQVINLPKDASLVVKADAVMAAIAAGEITIAHGGQLIDALSGLAKIHEACELESRLRALEGKLGGKDAQ